MNICKHFISLSAALLVLSPAAQATIIQTNAFSGSETYFDSHISSTDLVQGGGTTVVGSSTVGQFPVSGTNDGGAAHTNGLAFWAGWATPEGGKYVDITYALNGSPTGYDITGINSIYGWQDSRYRHAAQEWELWVATVNNPIFTKIWAVVYQPFAANDGAAGSTQVSLSDTTGLIAEGVTALRFHLTPYASLGQSGYTGELGVVREFDVFGSVSAGGASDVPEPASLALVGLGLAGLARLRRKQR